MLKEDAGQLLSRIEHLEGRRRQVQLVHRRREGLQPCLASGAQPAAALPFGGLGIEQLGIVVEGNALIKPGLMLPPPEEGLFQRGQIAFSSSARRFPSRANCFAWI